LVCEIQNAVHMHTTNYQGTFIAIAEDCPVAIGLEPPKKGEKKSIANLQFEILKGNAYKYTSDDVLFQVYAQRQDLVKSQLKEARKTFFSKGQACFRASPLAKRYGWGVHSDGKGRIAIYGCESATYQKFLKDKSVRIVKAMRSSK